MVRGMPTDGACGDGSRFGCGAEQAKAPKAITTSMLATKRRIMHPSYVRCAEMSPTQRLQLGVVVSLRGALQLSAQFLPHAALLQMADVSLVPLA